MELLALYQELQSNDVDFYLWDIPDSPAATVEYNGKYNIFVDMDAISTNAEEKIIIAHEGGHAMTGSTHKLYSPYDLIAKHEYKAQKWAIKKLVPIDELKTATKSGYTEIWQLAEYFDVPCSFMHIALDFYRNAGVTIREDTKN